jgi:XTP/dITP diphosphohydrolase
MRKQKVIYVTSNKFKEEENRIFCQEAVFPDGKKISDLFEFDIRSVPIKEILEVDLEVMVQAEVTSAYSQIRVPCIVEHAGLIFEDYKRNSYPGGLTKPMWDTLKDQFIEETKSAGRRAIARAVIAYCNGKCVQTFVGETLGELSSQPRGNRAFYWDTIFIPDDPSGKAVGKTYAEIAEDSSLGLGYKVVKLSQSGRAMLEFLSYRRKVGIAELWK